MKNIASLMEKYPDVVVIVSDDGSIDGTVERIERHNISDNLKILRCEHTGKWGALRSGFRKAKADYVLFLDFDFSVSYDVLDDMVGYKGDVLVGNRYIHPETKVPFVRRFLSWGFSSLVRLLSGLEMRDTQVPVKLIRKTKLLSDIMLVMQETGFVGDVEFLMMAKKVGAKIEEIPVKYIYREGAFNVVGNTKRMFFGLLRVVKRCR
jgi:glycosyltransferase involved in cell wall biosynthesis